MERYEWLKETIIKENFSRIAEIGVRDGKTMKFLLQNCPIKHYLGVDIDIHSDLAMEFGCKDGIVLLEQSSSQAAQFVEDGSFDLVFIDADHSYEAVANDIDNWISKVRKGGIICGHDFGNPYHQGVEKAVREFFRQHVLSTGHPSLVWYARVV